MIWSQHSRRFLALCLGLGITTGSALSAQAQEFANKQLRRNETSSARSGSTSNLRSTTGIDYQGLAEENPLPTVVRTRALAATAATARGSVRRTSLEQTETVMSPTPAPAARSMKQQSPYIAESSIAHGSGGMYSGPSCGGACGPEGCGNGSCGTSSYRDSCCRTCCADTYFYEPGYFAGVEYQYLRPHFGAAPAAVERTTFVDGSNNSTITDRVVSFDVDYESTYRLFGGYRWGDCGEAITFSYWTIDTESEYASGLVPTDLSVIFGGAFGINADSAGEQLFASFEFDLDVYDVEYSKRVSLGQHGTDCCPSWDAMWSFGVRVADFSRRNSNSLANASAAITFTGESNFEFVGAGPRIGGELRRYVGDCKKWSFYGRGFQSLLLGDLDADTRVTTVGAPTLVDAHTSNATLVIPVSEIELGFSRQIGCRTLLSGGYGMQVWWDLGRSDPVGNAGCGDCNGTVSNNLTMDGFFLRVEHTFGGWERPKCQTACCQ